LDNSVSHGALGAEIRFGGASLNAYCDVCRSRSLLRYLSARSRSWRRPSWLTARQQRLPHWCAFCRYTASRRSRIVR